MKTITVETTMQSNGVPVDLEVFVKTGGLFVLQQGCARKLLEQGCSQESIKFDQPSFIDGEWTLQGTGMKGDSE